MVRCRLFLLLIYWSCASSADIKTIIFKSEYGGFGYDIEMNGKLLVHQPNVPTIAGHRGFTTEQEAKNIAALVVLKIENNEMPPTLTPAELAKCLKQPLLLK